MTTPTMPMNCDGFADALADYLEGDASDGVRVVMDAHTASCAACRQLLADVNGLRMEAASLPQLAPSRDLWSGIAERIDARVIPMDTPRVAHVMTKRHLWTRPAIAAAALVLATAGSTYLLTRVSFSGTGSVSSTSSVPPLVAGDPTAEFVSTATERPSAPGTRLASAQPAMSMAEPVFASEISKLRKIVRERRSQLDPKTVLVLEQSIAVIDSAIAQSRAALANDPASGFLATQLNHSLEKKVELLRTAALLPSRT